MARRMILIFTAILLSSVAGLTLGAGKSEVATAAQKGDKATVVRLVA